MNKNGNFKRTGMFKRCALITSGLILAAAVIASISISSVYSLQSETPNLKPQQFNLETAYAYVGQGPSNDTFTDSTGALLSPISRYPSAVYLNVTRPTVEDGQCDAVLEVFMVNISPDKNLTETFIYFAGTNYTSSFSQEKLYILTEHIFELFDVNAVVAVRGNFRNNWTNNESVLSPAIGSYGIYTNFFTGDGLWSKGKPDAISVSYYRIGYVSMINGAVLVQPDIESVNYKSQVQLQENNGGFLKNNIIPTDQLPQTDMFKPSIPDNS
jgi:hypothetical protein